MHVCMKVFCFGLNFFQIDILLPDELIILSKTIASGMEYLYKVKLQSNTFNNKEKSSFFS